MKRPAPSLARPRPMEQDTSADEARIREMLAAGAEHTPIGRRSILRLPGAQTCEAFPTALVDRVKREERAKRAGA